MLLHHFRVSKLFGSYKLLSNEFVQGSVQVVTNIQSMVTTLQSLIILLSLQQLASIAYAIPFFRLITGMHSIFDRMS